MGQPVLSEHRRRPHEEMSTPWSDRQGGEITLQLNATRRMGPHSCLRSAWGLESTVRLVDDVALHVKLVLRIMSKRELLVRGDLASQGMLVGPHAV